MFKKKSTTESESTLLHRCFSSLLHFCLVEFLAGVDGKQIQPVSQLVRDTAGVMQEYTQRGGVRPFGVSLLVAGYDDDGPQLYQVDPSGAYFGWKATAIGKNFVNAKNFLEKR